MNVPLIPWDDLTIVPSRIGSGGQFVVAPCRHRFGSNWVCRFNLPNLVLADLRIEIAMHQ
jgi:hypothetical protein